MSQPLEVWLFLIMAGLAVVSAFGVVFNRNAVYSALSLLLNCAVLAVLYLMLNAQFVAMVQILVYAGAIVVLFLFVEMLLGASGQAGLTKRLSLRTLLVALGAIILLTLVGEVVFEMPINGQLGQATPERIAQLGQAQAVGLTLFVDYTLVFELTGVLLLVGLVGALLLGRNLRRAPQLDQPGAED